MRETKMPTEWTPERRAAFGEKMKARRAAKQPQTNTTKKIVAPVTQPEIIIKTPEIVNVPTLAPAVPQLLTFTPEQLNQLIAGLSSGNTSTAASNAFTSLGQQQTNINGQVIGSIEKFNIDPDYYPNPIEELTTWFDTDTRTRRLAFSENYYVTWEITTKPYDTKYGTSMREPTFNLTLYTILYDDEGNDTGRYRVVQAFFFNEDESSALEIAAALGYKANHENMREVMNKARYERVKRWLITIFFPEHNYDLAQQYTEEAIDGRVVKVVTKSNVVGNATPSISIDEIK